MRVLAALIAVFITLPISFYIQYALLKAIQADRLLWFLYWIDIPLLMFVQMALKLTEKK